LIAEKGISYNHFIYGKVKGEFAFGRSNKGIYAEIAHLDCHLTGSAFRYGAFDACFGAGTAGDNRYGCVHCEEYGFHNIDLNCKDRQKYCLNCIKKGSIGVALLPSLSV
jgi:hypothetical protein